MLGSLLAPFLTGLVLATIARGDQRLQQPLPGQLPGYVESPEPNEIEFRLTHVFHHGTTAYPDLHRRLTVSSEATLWLEDESTKDRERMPRLSAQVGNLKIQRLSNRSPEFIDSMLETARMVGRPASIPASAWTIDDVPGPNVSHKPTILTMARAASNAYHVDPSDPQWEDVKGSFNYTEDFGWEDDGIRGHIFADKTNQTVIVGLKGTTVAVWDGSGTTTKDKLNDNLFFGCCCGEGSLWTKKPCTCSTATYTCNSTCVADALRHKNRYYYSAKELYYNVTELYPDAQVWLAGHSLGGSVASLLGMTFGIPVVTFEAPGEAMAASRLGLPTPPGYRIGDNEPGPSSSSFHFGHNADPLYLGTCGSACYAGGYAMESVCHSGMECVYNTTGELGWGTHISNHGIKTVLHQVLEYYNETAKCEVVKDCNDCFNWKYFESNSSETTTASSAPTPTYSRTRTETCKTPGWFGCLDETTSTPSMTTSRSRFSHTIVPTTSTSTCHTPGRFWGCLDKTTPAATAHAAVPRPTSTGAFGAWYAHELADTLR